MTPENSKIVWKYMQAAGERLVGRLPKSRSHPKGRNPYAHVAICVRKKFGKTYSDLPDDKIGQVMEFIDWLVENPS